MKTVLLLALVPLAGCSFLDGDVYTLYRTSAVLPNARLHVATFDAADGDQYNNENCNLAASLFQRQPGIETRFWCEKGRFHK